MSVYALVDVNAFYCSAETLFQPWLRDKAVAVASNNDGCLVARNDHAKALGLKMGQPVFEVKHLIERGQLYLFSSNYELYQSISNRIMGVLDEMAPRLFIYSIDEAFADLTGVPDPEVWGRRAQYEVASRLGMPVGVGIAPTLTLAKLANYAAKKWKKKTGCVVSLLDPEKRDKLLKYAPVDEVWGIGRRITKRLESEFRIKTAWDLATADPKVLRRHFGVTVERTARELQGIACYPFGADGPERKQMIASTRSFGKRIHRLEDLETAVAAFVARAADKLRSQNSLAQCIQVFANTSPFAPGPAYGGSRNVQFPYPTSDTRDITSFALQGLRHLYREGFAYAKAGVILSQFVEDGSYTGDLFAPKPREKSKQVMSVMDAINAKQGRGAIRLAIDSTSGPWKMQRKHLSPAYTTNWADLPKAGAGRSASASSQGK